MIINIEEPLFPKLFVPLAFCLKEAHEILLGIDLFVNNLFVDEKEEK